MAGLLDALQSDSGLLGLYLMSAGAAKPQRTSLGEGLLGGMQMMQQRRTERDDRAQKQKMQDLQMQQLQGALAQQQEQAAQLKRAQEQEAQFRGLIQSPQGAASSAALAGGGGPTVANAQRMQPVDPLHQLQFEAMRLGQIKPMDYLNAQRKDDAPLTVAPGAALVRKNQQGGYDSLFQNPKDDKTPESLRTLELIYGKDTPQYQAAARQLAAKMTTHQPGTKVEVNTGQKGFDNTLKLRGDFRSEPIYKAHQEMQSAYSQIQQSLKQASPAGDLAGATKMMKLLDPGSVVRESELGMAMQASGLMDRVRNYATNIMAGTKLMPTQRADFQRLADALYSESVKQYNGKRTEYQGIAERNGLSVPDVLGPTSTAPTSKVVNFGDLK